jgi:glycosyltransferase involved in cell wall biosynthesis
LESAGVDVRYLGKKAGLDFSLYGKLRKLFQKEKPDAVHTHLYAPKYVFPAAVLAGVKNRVHTVHNVAEKESGSADRKLNALFFRHCGVIPVALSDLIRDSVAKVYAMDKDAIPVIQNGVDLSKCLPKKEYGRAGNFKILHIGRFSEQKNHEGLLRAFAQFHEKHPDSELWLIGEGEAKESSQAFVAEQNLSESVKFLGAQSRVHGFLHDADMFTLPSLYEGVPITLIEAMGTGLPIVATAVGGVPDMLDAESALLVPVDVDQIAQAFETCYLQDALRQSHGEEAKKRAERFSSVTMAEKYSDLYSKGLEIC